MKLLLFELILTGIVFTTLFFGFNGESLTRRAERVLARIEKRPFLSSFGIVVLAIALRAACLGFFPPPQPVIHDEFSYLLAADTFASGRLSNPTHPHWEFFESFHINQIPTYSSMYPPAQGLVLAAGKIIGGNAWLGALVSTALMCGMLCWMLHGWLPARWAVIGGVIAVIRIALFSYWGNSFWGGSVAAIGGLLLLGSIPRLAKKNSSAVYFLTLSVGILIMANSRPFEGLVLCFATTLAALSWRPLRTRLVTSKWVIAVVVLLVGFAAMGFYNWRVTGHPTVFPYQINQRQYAMAGPFLWQTPSASIAYHHQIMKDFWTEYFVQAVRARSSFSGFLDLVSDKVYTVWVFFVGPVMSVPLITLPRALRDRRIRFVVLVALFAIPGILVETWFHAHYAAPFTGVIYVFVLQSLRHLRFSRLLSPRTRYALFLTVPAVLIGMVLVAVVTFPRSVQGRDYGMWCCNPNGRTSRSLLLNELQSKGGRHLVFVEYTSDHNPHEEWVYNTADIDSAPVVFARDMGTTKDMELIQYFSDRQVWRLVVDDRPLKLEPMR